MKAIEVYSKSDGELTKMYYAKLEKLGPVGLVAVCIFRAQKCSTRAKRYRGGNSHGHFKDQAYERKNWSMGLLCKSLQQNPLYQFGWKPDPGQEWNPWVLYIDLPQGQVSFHSPTRGVGPDYPGDWDQTHLSEARIIQFCDSVMEAATA